MALYSNITEDEVREFGRAFGLEISNSLHMPGGMSNTSHLVTAGSQHYVLTLIDNPFSLKTQRMLDLLLHLSQAGINVPRPLTTVDGSPTATVGEHKGWIKHFVEGTCYTMLPDDLLQSVGEVVAHIHGVPPCDGLSKSVAEALPDAIDTITEFAEPWFVEWLNESTERTRNVAAFDGPRGLTHGDLFADNIVFTPDGKFVVLDWDTSCVDLFVVDIAISITGIANSHGTIDVQRASELVAGYSKIRPLTDRESAIMREAIEYAAFALAVWRFRRHNVHFPDPKTADRYLEAVRLAESVRSPGWHLQPR